ncbi:MAG: hypothetical protein A4E28_02733 [Methanocella sp. PtaU1.Bin125]|nr:MAG: hypothetical protein A4E28_02733 [Methanocella sp. PtaU1.Bin125]
MDKDSLVIPIYLDTNILMDLLASIEDGFSMVETVKKQSANSSKTEFSGNGNIGTGLALFDLLDIIKIDLKGTASKAAHQKTEEERQAERYHTAGSLLNKLRRLISDEKIILQINNEETWNAANVSDFIETSGRFVPNPLYDSLITMKKIIEFITTSTDMESKQKELTPIYDDLIKRSKTNTPSKKLSQEEVEKLKSITQELETIKNLKFIDTLLNGFITDLERSGKQTYVVELDGLTGFKGIITLHNQFNKDSVGFELPYGNFKLLGKVVRKVNEGESYNLLRGSALSGIDDSILGQLLGGFSKIREGGINIPELTTKVDSPAIQIIPIAIFV